MARPQTEFYELQSLGKIPSDALTAVPDAYQRIALLEEETMKLRAENEKLKSLAGYVFCLLWRFSLFACSSSCYISSNIYCVVPCFIAFCVSCLVASFLTFASILLTFASILLTNVTKFSPETKHRKARGMWDKLRKERDHHRMHHRRVAQEKDKLLNDLRRLKTHIDG